MVDRIATQSFGFNGGMNLVGMARILGISPRLLLALDRTRRDASQVKVGQVMV